MKASVLTGPKQMRLENVTIPEPGAGEVRLKLQGCGVCGSNLASWVGMPWTKYPMPPGALGHEGWGFVDAVGPGVRGIKIGDRVAALSDKAYAEYDIARADRVIPVPLTIKEFPGEAVGCAMNIFRRSDIQKGQTVAIIGIGFLGALLTRLVSQAGARVIAISRRPFSLEIAKKMGAQELIALDDHYKIIERVKEITQQTFCDRVIEAIGQQWPLDLSAELTRERGKLIIAGYHQDGPRQINMQLWNWRGLDVINAHERDPEVYVRGIREALSAIEAKIIDPSILYTHRFPIDRLDAALNANLERPDGFMKALVVYE